MAKNRAFMIARVIAIVMLIIALGKNPYNYYKLLRFVVCSVCIYGVCLSQQLTKRPWIWGFSIIAVLFNPVIPLHLDRETWAVVNIAVAAGFLLSIWLIKD